METVEKMQRDHLPNVKHGKIHFLMQHCINGKHNYIEINKVFFCCFTGQLFKFVLGHYKFRQYIHNYYFCWANQWLIFFCMVHFIVLFYCFIILWI